MKNPSTPISFSPSDFLKATFGSRLDLCAAPSMAADPHVAAASLESPAPDASRRAQPAPAARHPGGRPSTCTEENVGLICHGIAQGRSETAAAALVGIAGSTLSRWRKKYPEILVPFASAREQFRTSLLDRLFGAKTRDGRDDWRAAAWLLERVFPEDYGRKGRASASSQDDSYDPAFEQDGINASDEERPSDSLFADLAAERRRLQAELEALNALQRSLESEAATPEAPTSETSETQFGVTATSSNAPAAPSSETPETPVTEAGQPAEVASELHEVFVDSFSPGLSRRERRRREHLQRKSEAAQLRSVARSAPLAKAA